jgi:branched-chain amino acid transport system substrate-binding protein
MQRRKFLILVVSILGVLLMVSLSLAGCGNGGTSTPTTTAPTTTAPTTATGRTEIVIGAINAMTGPEAMVGNEHRWAYQTAVADVNAKGGVFVKELNKKLPVRLIVVDDQSDQAKSAAAAEQLIKKDNVDFLLGSVDTPLNIASGAVVEKYKKLMVNAVMFTNVAEEQKFSWVVDSFFDPGALLNAAVATLAPIAIADRPKNWCVLVGDNPDGEAFGGGAKAFIEGSKEADGTNSGYKVALYQKFIEGTADFSSSIQQMKANKCDALLTLIGPSDAIALVRQIKEAKLDLKYIWGARGMWPIEFGEALGKDANYIVSDGHWAEGLGAPGSKELGDRYRAQFGATKNSVVIGNPYSAVQALFQAIETAGSIDGQKVRDVYFSGTFVAKGTTEGDLAFNNKGVANFSPVALQWMDGKRMPVFPVSPSYKIQLAPAWSAR